MSLRSTFLACALCAIGASTNAFAQTTTALYLCPIEVSIPRNVQTTRCRGEGTQTSSIMSNPEVNWALTAVTADTEGHAVIESKSGVVALVNVGGGDLDNPLGVTRRSVLAAEFEARNIPANWIDESTTGRLALRVLARVLILMQLIPGEDYPNLTLDQTLGNLTAAHRARIRAWMTSQGIDTNINNMTLRQWLRHVHDGITWPIVHLGAVLLD